MKFLQTLQVLFYKFAYTAAPPTSQKAKVNTLYEII